MQFDKLPKPSMRAPENDPKTDEEWETYFELRKIYDKPMDEATKLKVLDKLDEIIYKGEGFVELGQTYPLPPDFAWKHKHLTGLKSVQYFNLYEAKLEFPDEF